MHVGDFLVKVATAFFGAYLITCNILKLIVVPFVPTGAEFAVFLSYKPDLTKALLLDSSVTGPLIGSPYVYGPVLFLALLTAIGATVQVKTLKKEEDEEALIRK
jgi:hypothetical protein